MPAILLREDPAPELSELAVEEHALLPVDREFSLSRRSSAVEPILAGHSHNSKAGDPGFVGSLIDINLGTEDENLVELNLSVLGVVADYREFIAFDMVRELKMCAANV